MVCFFVFYDKIRRYSPSDGALDWINCFSVPWYLL